MTNDLYSIDAKGFASRYIKIMCYSAFLKQILLAPAPGSKKAKLPEFSLQLADTLKNCMSHWKAVQKSKKH